MIELNLRTTGCDLPQVTSPRRTLAVLSAVPLGLLLGLLGALVAPASPARAHAVLTSTTPAAGAVVAAAPATVRLSFSEPVRVVPGRTQVLAPNGKRVNDGDPVGVGGELRIALNATDRTVGTYLVSYRVISADSHPISGTFTFSVGTPSAAAPRPAREGAHPVVAVALPVAKYVGYAGIVLVVGPVLLLATLWPRRLPTRAPLRLARAGLGLIAAGTVAALWLQVPYTTGAGPLDVSPVELRQVLDDRFGVALLVRLMAVAAVATLLTRAVGAGRPVGGGRRWPVVGLVALGLVALATWPPAGHPAASPQPLLTAVADLVHLAAMAVWLGGLAALVLLLRRADRRELAVILPVWSRWALLAVYWLVAGGLVQALVEVGGLEPLVETWYGRLLLAKAGLLVAVLAVAVYSRRLVRRWRALTTARPARRLGRAVGAELAIAALVLAASAVLVQTTPARNAGIEAAAAEQARGFATTLDSPLYSVQFEIFPAQVGPYNTFHAFLYTPQGRPVAAAEWKLTTSLPGSGVEPIDNPVVSIRGNQGIGPVDFPLPGRWQLRLTVRISETEQATVSTTVPVG